MKTITFYLLSMLLSVPAVSAEVTRKTVVSPYGTIEHVFYSEGREIAKQMVDKHDRIIKTTGSIPDGSVRQHYESGKLRFEWNYKDNKLNGIAKGYDENGNLDYEWIYQDGEHEGMSREYYKSGKLKVETNFKSGSREGVVREYYENGHVKIEGNNKNGKLLSLIHI